jgi:hypothetical protein
MFRGHPHHLTRPALVLVVGCYCLALLLIGVGSKSLRIRELLVLAGGLAIAIVAAGVSWAMNPYAWNSVIAYRRFVLVVQFPLLVGAVYQWWKLHGPAASQEEIRFRLTNAGSYIGLAGALIFSVIFVVQSCAWNLLLQHFGAELESVGRGPVVTGEQLAWIRGTPLEHWSSTQLSAILEGRSPNSLFVLDPSQWEGSRIHLFCDQYLPRENRWFRLNPDSPQ